MEIFQTLAMGINGLLKGINPIFSSATKQRNISSFAQKSLAVDVSSWLHKAGYAIADNLVEAVEAAPENLDWKQRHPKIVSSLVKHIQQRCTELFRYANIHTLYLVLDGPRRVPLKADTAQQRSDRRHEHLQKAREFMKQGRREKAAEEYRTCVKVPHDLAKVVLRAIQSPNLKIVMAPYEADAQMTQLALDGQVHAVITEDSDLLVYSAAVGVPFDIITKLNRHTGACEVVSTQWLFGSDNTAESKKPGAAIITYLTQFRQRELACAGQGRRLFVQACVLAGCDYVASLDGIGFITACKHITKHIHRPHEKRFQFILREWRGTANNSTTIDLEEYEELLLKSEAVFYHHYVQKGSGQDMRVAYMLPAQVQDQMPDLAHFKGQLDFLGTDDPSLHGSLNFTFSNTTSITNARWFPSKQSRKSPPKAQPNNSSISNFVKRKPLMSLSKTKTRVNNPYSLSNRDNTPLTKIQSTNQNSHTDENFHIENMIRMVSCDHKVKDKLKVNIHHFESPSNNETTNKSCVANSNKCEILIKPTLDPKMESNNPFAHFFHLEVSSTISNQNEGTPLKGSTLNDDESVPSSYVGVKHNEEEQEEEEVPSSYPQEMQISDHSRTTFSSPVLTGPLMDSSVEEVPSSCPGEQNFTFSVISLSQTTPLIDLTNKSKSPYFSQISNNTAISRRKTQPRSISSLVSTPDSIQSVASPLSVRKRKYAFCLKDLKTSNAVSTSLVTKKCKSPSSQSTTMSIAEDFVTPAPKSRSRAKTSPFRTKSVVRGGVERFREKIINKKSVGKQSKLTDFVKKRSTFIDSRVQDKDFLL